MPIALAPAVAAGAAGGPLAPITIPISILLSAIFGRKLFGGGGEDPGPQPYGVGQWQINPGDPWYGQPVDPNTGLHQSLVDQIWSMAPPEGLPASMLQSNSSLGIPNWAAIRLQRIGWELGGWQNLLDVLKNEPGGKMPEWLTSRMQWGINPLVDGTQGGVPYDMSDWLKFSTTVYGAPWGLIIGPDGNAEMGQIPEGQQPDHIDPATGMPVYTATVTELPGTATPPPAAEPTFPEAPAEGSTRLPETAPRGDREPRPGPVFSTTVTAPMPTEPTPTPPPVAPPLPIPAPTPPVIPPVMTPSLPPPEFPGPPTAEPPLIPPPTEPPVTPPPGGTPSIPNLPFAGGIPNLGGGGPLPGGFVVVPGGNPYQSLFQLPMPGVRPVPSLGQFIGR